jgi:hypothetical protein
VALTQQPPATAGTQAAEHAVAALTLGEEFGGSRLLIADLRTAWLLVDAARHSVLRRMFGVPKEQERLLTLVLLLMAADGAGRNLRRMLAVPAPPSAGDSLLGGAFVSGLIGSMAGTTAQETPTSALLIALALVAGTTGPAVAKSPRGIRSSGHRASVGFHHRYGYLVDPGHWRQRRAERTEARARAATAPAR